MKKILELDQKDFLSGVSQMAYGNRGGLFYSAPGICPFVDNSYTSKNFGLLQTSAAPTDMTGAVVVDEIQNWAVEATAASTGYLYGYGNSGNFYVIVLATNAISNERSGGDVITNPASGMAIYGGNLYYAQLTQIGQCSEETPPFDTSSTWDNDWSVTTGGGAALDPSFFYHPMYLFSGRLWIGNSEKLDLISGSTPAYTSNVLTLESDYKIMCLEDDGSHLVIGATQNLGDKTIMAKTKVSFWDTYSTYTSREWTIPDPNISAIKKMGGWLYAFGGRGIYRFSYGSAPQNIAPMLNSASGLDFGRHQAVDNWGGNMLVWGGTTSLRTFGSPMPGYPQAFFTPFAGSATGNGIGAITANAKAFTIYGSTSNNKLYRWATTSGGSTGLAATTNFISLPKKTKVEAIKVIFGNKLSSGDSLNIDVNADSGDTASDYGTIAHTTHGAVRRATITGSFEAEDLQLVFNFTAGNVKIRRVEVWGEPQENALE